MILAIILSMAYSQILLDYRFGKNYGETFYDFSGNKNHGINGNGIASYKVKSTDRGIFLTQGINFITIPSNFSYPSIYAVNFWIMSNSTNGLIFVKNSKNYYYNLGKLDQVNSIASTENSTNSNTLRTYKDANSFFPCNIYLDQWALIRLKYDSSRVTCFVNLNQKYIFDLKDIEFSPHTSIIGSDSQSSPALSSFIWRFIIDNSTTSSSYISLTTTIKCLIPATPCPQTQTQTQTQSSAQIDDPDYGIGILSSSTSASSNVFGQSCMVNSQGCFNKTLLSCTSTSKSCIYNAALRTCASKDLSTGVETQFECICIEGCMMYNNECSTIDCATKDSLNKCITCKASNSYVGTDGRCYCNPGYFGSLLLSSTSSCTQCTSSCKTCSKLGVCDSCGANAVLVNGLCSCHSGYNMPSGSTDCIACGSDCGSNVCTDINSVSVNGVCTCVDGYFGSGVISDMNPCIKCNDDCSICTSLTNCTKCSDANAVAVSGICSCADGYFVTGVLSPTNPCKQCSSDCSVCTSQTYCSKCLDTNSIATSGVCSCNEGYFVTGTLSSTNPCTKCSSDCSICTSLTNCTKCSDVNAVLASGVCSCANGYFVIGALSPTNPCIKCSSDCSICTSLTSCTQCSDTNAAPTSGVCLCKSGYFVTGTLSPTNPCIQCNSDCSICSSLINCSKCSDTNAIAISGICSCANGYFVIGTLSPTNPCKNCSSDCSICTSLTSCTKCLDPNATPISGVCSCNDGYYSLSSICQKCMSSCKTCKDDKTCDTCHDIHYDPASTDCSCLKGYYKDTITSCKLCGTGCSECSSAQVCTSCKDSIAKKNNGVCDCPLGYTWNQLVDKCIQCDLNCEICDFSLYCSKCTDINSYLDSGKCPCLEGFFWDFTLNQCYPCLDTCKNCTNALDCDSCLLGNSFGPYCQECHASCLTCEDEFEYSCTSCYNSSLLNGFCYEMCPIGFVEVNETCLIDGFTKIFSVNFESIGKYFELVNNFTFDIGGVQRSRYLKDNGIKTAYKRGIYCKGSGFLDLALSKTELLGQTFAFSVWVNPLSQSGSIFSRYSSSNQSQASESSLLQSLTLSSLRPHFTITISDESHSLSPSSSLPLKSWSHLFISLEFSQTSTLKFTINKSTDKNSLTISKRYKESSDSLLYIANDFASSFGFIGFIFSFEIYSTDSNFDSILQDLVTNDCNGCSACPLKNDCILNCLFEEYYDETTDSCVNCGKDCEAGCKEFQVCNACADEFCFICAGLAVSSCVECLSGFEVKDGKCRKCGEDEYYSLDYKRCKACEGLCFSCSDKDVCIHCNENSFMESQGKCSCDFGFERIGDRCVRGNFTAEFWVSKDVEIHVTFSEILAKDLGENDLEVKINGEVVSFGISQIDSRTYIISPSLSQGKDILIELGFKNILVSKLNHVLLVEPYEKTVTSQKEDHSSLETAKKAEVSKQAAQSSIAAAGSASVSFALLAMDPSSIFDFLNTAEIFYSVYLFNLEINPILESFLLNYRVQGYMPNSLKFILDENQGQKLKKKYRKFGYNSNLLLINLGPQLQTLILFVVMFIVINLLSLVKYCKQKLMKTNQKFIFNIFIRIWIQTFLETLIAIYVSLTYNQRENTTQIIDFCFTILLIVILI